MVRQYHMLSIKQAREPIIEGKNWQGAELASQVLYLDGLDVKDEHRRKKSEAVGHTETLQLFCDDKEKFVKILLALIEVEKDMFVRCLSQNSDVFTWFAVDMPGVDSWIIVHKLYVLPEVS